MLNKKDRKVICEVCDNYEKLIDSLRKAYHDHGDFSYELEARQMEQNKINHMWRKHA